MKKEIQERLATAGVEVIEARISHLAYAPEIAQAMLQRQQAGAIIAARQRIVEGAVGMVEMALEMLSKREIVELDNERKAAMVSNLLVVLCGERGDAAGHQHGHDLSVTAVAERKPFLLRIDKDVLDAVQRWADDDLRSLNGQIEFLLQEGVGREREAEGRAASREQEALGLFVLFFVRRQRPRRRAQRLAVVEERQIADVERQRAPRRLLVDHDRDRAAFDAVAEADAATASQTRVREPFQHRAGDHTTGAP